MRFFAYWMIIEKIWNTDRQPSLALIEQEDALTKAGTIKSKAFFVRVGLSASLLAPTSSSFDAEKASIISEVPMEYRRMLLISSQWDAMRLSTALSDGMMWDA